MAIVAMAPASSIDVYKRQIYDAAYSAKDFRTMQFLDWFVKEQGEEETNAEGLVKKFELFGDDPKKMCIRDR